MNYPLSILNPKFLSVAAMAALALASAGASAQSDEMLKLDIKPQNADSALITLAKSSGVQIILAEGAGANVEIEGLKGEYRFDEALAALLTGTGLTHEFAGENLVVIQETERTGEPEDADEAPPEEEEEPLELPQQTVTGTRLNLNPAEATGNRLVIDRAAIEASGEFALHRILRQLPQNANGTTPVIGADLNGGFNFSGAATVNLRGLGSDSTLILVDGRRMGAHGLTGGVTDISSIPLSLVERVEILFEGASAIYGADAAGGVINIITRKDYENLDVSFGYSEPADGGFREIFADLNGSLAWDSGRLRFDLDHSDHNGLDAASRNLLVPNEVANPHIYNTGPQMLGASANFPRTPVLYRSPSGNITVSQFRALTTAEQASFSPVMEFNFPENFNGDINTITDFGGIDFPVEISGRNRTLLPLQERSSVHLGLEQDLLPGVNLIADITYSVREVETKQGNASLDVVWEPRSPSNPFGERVTLRGWIPGEFPVNNLHDGRDFNTNIVLKGKVGAGQDWEWEMGAGYSRNASDTLLVNLLSLDLRAGVASDGVTPQVSFFTIPTQISTDDCLSQGGVLIIGGTWCQISQVFPHIHPFNDDLSQYVDDAVPSGSKNYQTRFDAILRGELFKAPGGAIKVLVGGSWQDEGLETVSESVSNSLSFGSPIFGGAFNSDSSRKQKALFLEGYAPIVSGANAMPGVSNLGISFAVRWDDYDPPESSRFGEPLENLCRGDNTSAGIACDTEFSDASYSLGAVYNPVDDQIRFRANWSTAFVAPQLNQLIRAPVATSRGFDIRMPLPAGGACPPGTAGPFPPFVPDACFVPVVAISGGNPTLGTETADTFSVGFDVRPKILPGLDGRVTWSRLKARDRIEALRVFAIPDLDSLPSNMRRETIQFDPVSGQPTSTPMEVIIQDRRATNVAEVVREGVDIFVGYRAETGIGGFDFSLNYARLLTFRVTDDPATGQTASIVGKTESGVGLSAPSLPAVPKHSLNAQAGWTLGGLSLSANFNHRSATQRIFHVAAGGRLNYETQQPTILNLSLRYSFEEDTLFEAPGWLHGTVVRFYVNNATNDFVFSESTEYDATGALVSREPFDLSPMATFATGRSFGVELRRSF